MPSRPIESPGQYPLPLREGAAGGVKNLAGLCALVAGFCAVPAHAADIRQVDVTRDGDRYRVDMDVRLNVDARRAYEVFADPARLPQINPSVKVARLLSEPDSNRRLYTEVQLCATVFCHTLHQVQDMGGGMRADGWLLTADVIPARSDLTYGHAEWHFASQGASTDLRLHLEVVPAFWVPPFFGPWLVQRMLREQAEVTCAGIERLAST